MGYNTFIIHQRRYQDGEHCTQRHYRHQGSRRLEEEERIRSHRRCVPRASSRTFLLRWSPSIIVVRVPRGFGYRSIQLENSNACVDDDEVIEGLLFEMPWLGSGGGNAGDKCKKTSDCK